MLYMDDASLKLAPSPTITLVCARLSVVPIFLGLFLPGRYLTNNVPMFTKYVM